MNRVHQRLCRSDWWSRVAENRIVPWVVDGLDLGDSVLEIGPGYGATTRVLARPTPRLTVVEIDPDLAARLREQTEGDVEVLDGDGTAMPVPTESVSAVVCFTMLHHVSSPHDQDRLFAEAYRILRPAGVFAGSDSVTTLSFRLIHLFDTMVIVDPDTLADRLEAVGFEDVQIDVVPRQSFRFRARKPG